MENYLPLFMEKYLPFTMLRKYTKTKTIYPTDEAVRKSVYLSIQEITKKWSMPIRNWGTIIGLLMIFYEDRFNKTA